MTDPIPVAVQVCFAASLTIFLSVLAETLRLTRKNYYMIVAAVTAATCVGVILTGLGMLYSALGVEGMGLVFILAVLMDGSEGRHSQTTPAKKPQKPYRIPFTSQGEIEYISSAEVMSDRAIHIRFGAAINRQTVGLFIAKCVTLQNLPRRTVYIHINSEGGNVNSTDMMAAHIIELNRHHDVYMVANGQCSSAALSVFTRLPVERRLAFENTEFIIHGGAVHTDGSVILHESDNLPQRWLDSLSYFNRVYVEEISGACAVITPEAMEHIIKNQIDYVLFSREAVYLGLISKIVKL